MTDEFYKKTESEFQEMTQSYFQQFSKMWQQMFSEESWRDNLCKLINHTDLFFQDLMAETETKREYIENEISKLKNEATHLSSLLKLNVELPSFENREVPLLTMLSEIDEALNEVRRVYEERQSQINELMLEQESLCELLGEKRQTLTTDPLASPSQVTDFIEYLNYLKVLRTERTNIVSTIKKEIKQYLQLLELPETEQKYDRLIKQLDSKLDKDILKALEKMRDYYAEKVTKMQDDIQNMRIKVNSLWKRLNVSPTVQKRFERFNNNNQRTYDAYFAEVQRCEDLKLQNIKEFVESTRNEIKEMWDKTFKSEEERSRFTYFYDDYYDDDLLKLHERELTALHCYYEQNKEIFKLYIQRQTLWDHMELLDAKAKEPSRFNNRGGQLLKDEKDRKATTLRLKKIEEKLRELVFEYESREKSNFLVNGENILEVMNADWNKKNIVSARKQPQTPVVKRSIKKASMSEKHVRPNASQSTPNIRHTSRLPVSTTQKGKKNAPERNISKRNLMASLNASNKASPVVFKTPFRGPVIPKSLKNIRRSLGLSSSGKKRRSANCVTTANAKRQLLELGREQTYESFQSIEPVASSSIIQN